MKVVVLCGGLSSERHVSLVTGSSVCRALREEGFAGAEPAFENEAARIYRVA